MDFERKEKPRVQKKDVLEFAEEKFERRLSEKIERA